ncbi:hypothetical protein FK545_19960 [Planococcus glaciei]|nr:hypothetical protein FK545_00080 [Planococcus glaciei]QDY46778.1 hypothetical protein FK545_19960 [Planococcus glaciei]
MLHNRAPLSYTVSSFSLSRFHGQQDSRRRSSGRKSPIGSTRNQRELRNFLLIKVSLYVSNSSVSKSIHCAIECFNFYP